MNKAPRSHNRLRRLAVGASTALLGSVLLSGCGYDKAPVDAETGHAAPTPEKPRPTATETVTETPTATPPTSENTVEASPSSSSEQPQSDQDVLRRAIAKLNTGCNLDGVTSYKKKKDGKWLRIATLDVSYSEQDQGARAARENIDNIDTDITFRDTSIVVMNYDRDKEPDPYFADKTAGTHLPRNSVVEFPEYAAEDTTYVVMAYDRASDGDVETRVLTPCGSLTREDNTWTYEGNSPLPEGVEDQYIWDNGTRVGK